MIDPKALLDDLKAQVRNLERDLRSNGEDVARLRAEWEEARSHGRTAAGFEATWLPERVTQVAVAWVLATVFVRFAEDNGLIADAFIAGPGERTAQARERQEAYFHEEANQHKTQREWLRAAFGAMSVSPVARGLFADHNPMWTIAPGNEAARDLLEFWRRPGPDGEIVHDFTDEEWNTRFLGDLYQDLSEAARKTYALLQTPDFVEEFILRYTLDPAIEEFGLEPDPPRGHENLPRRLRVIDPACGSGHFLLGAFARLLRSWESERPGADKRELVASALASVHGVDKNPFAVAIARFRLLLAAMRAAGVQRLDERVDFPLNVAAGDSLLHGWKYAGSQDELPYDDEKPAYTYATEDIDDYAKSVHMLAWGSYHAVVANPPYITVSDSAEKGRYRELYPSCYREYSLSVPFAERIFKLAIRGSLDGTGAGYTGQITANSFMKREFGKKLIQEFFTQVDLTHIVDTSGAYLPGFGTPTVTLFGRWRYARRNSTIRAVLGIRGEPDEPADAATGMVWRAILSQIDRPGSESDWVGVYDIDRSQFAKHPWSLGGGGATELRTALESVALCVLGARVESIGFIAVTREDDAYLIGFGSDIRMALSPDDVRHMSGGTGLRDWHLEADDLAIFPYSADGVRGQSSVNVLRHLWKFKRHLAERRALSGTQEERGLPWFTYSDFHPDRFTVSHKIGFSFVSTHNHYVMIPGGHLLIRSAPMIKLSGDASADDCLELLGVLNSSTACFWLKQVSHDKGNRGGERSTARYAWESFFEFTGAKLGQFPLPKELPLEFGRGLDSLAQRLAAVEPSAVCASGVPTREGMDAARMEHERIWGQMIALQEELDWDVYRRYGLLTEAEAAELVAEPESVRGLKLGERAFEFLLAKRLDGAQGEKQWFERHRSTPVTEIPSHWPDEYKAVVGRRIEIIQRNRHIGLIERPECKRRWQSESWEDKEKKAVTGWLLDRCEERALWFGADGRPRPMTLNRLADRLREDADVVSVARLLKGPDAELAAVLAEITDGEHVPYLARLRYKPEGMVKRAAWEGTWDLQRQEDATGERLDIPVPPKYKNADFQKPSYWRNRGKLDVPKERFISYPRASPDSDASLLLGWAGWDHREQADALRELIDQRETVDGWDAARLGPLIDGLAEVMPWVRQWHNEVDPDFGRSPADAYDAYLAAQRERHGLRG